MSDVTVTLPDGSERSAPRGTTVRDFAAASLPASVVKKALAATVDGKLVDLTYPLDRDATVKLMLPDGADALALYRHSTAHLLAAAVTQLFPGAQCGIGPATDDGFFYDFVVSRPFVPEDLEKIEARMRELAGQDLIYERQIWPRDEALAFFAKRGEPLKVQLIEEKTAGQSHVSCYTIKDRDTFVDFCVGPHVPSTGRLKAFKLMSVSNAYWKGDAQNQPMQRIYGTAFFKDDELKQHLHRIEEAKKRDHRRIGKDIGLFMFHPWAPGAAFWSGKGTTLYHLLADYMREVLKPAGYQEVKTPLIYNKALWETSGHWQHYQKNMFLVESEEVLMSVKPMNCPGHMLVFASQVRSYRDLPLRLHEQTPLHRNEASGVLSGLTRVRQFSQDDAHCFVMESQIGEEVGRLIALVERVYRDFALEYEVELSTRPDEFLGEDRDVGPRRAGAHARARGVRPPVPGGRQRRQLLRPEDRLSHQGRDRPEVAVRDDPTRLPDPAALRPEVRRGRQRPAPAGRHSPRHFRQLRAVRGAAARAPRGRVSALAGPRTGHRAADCRPAPGLRGVGRVHARRRRPACGAGPAAGEDRS